MEKFKDIVKNIIEPNDNEEEDPEDDEYDE